MPIQWEMNKRKWPEPSAGDVFNSLTVIGLSHKDSHHRKFFLCRCACGTEKAIQGTLLASGNTKGCGCQVAVSAKSRRLPNDAGVINQLKLQYIRHAKGRGFSFDLTSDEFGALIRGRCFYCDEEHGNVKKTKNHPGFKYNGIDRVDSSLGYHRANCVPCCCRCNFAKLDSNQKEFVEWAHRVSKNMMAKQWGDHLLLTL